jgi:amino acid permease
MERSTSRAIIKIGSVVFFLLVILWGRVFYGSIQDYKTGETLLKENQTIRAITYFDRSLHWYAPLNPYLERSAKRLWEIGERAEKEGDIRMARIAFESIRNAFYGTSHVFTPGQKWIDRAETRIKKLTDGRAYRHGEDAKAAEAPKRSHPHVVWSVAVVLGFLGWVGSAFGFIISVFRKDRGTEKAFRKGLVWLCLILAFAALWVAGMVMA